jgi:epoxyqueuosine reductase
LDTPRQQIRAHAMALGFDAVGFAPAILSDEAKAGLSGFIQAGYCGDMGWLADKAERRRDPQALWPEARSVVVLGLNYGAAQTPPSRPGTDHGDISIYARNRDYHDLIKQKLKALGRWMGETFGCGIKVFVDTAPVMEKPLAQNAGIGWQGKHTNLVSREFGSWLFLGEVFTDLLLDGEAPESDHCGECRRCLDACPTAAFPEAYRLDARRCISYLTIEHKGAIDRSLRPLMGNRIYGCDDCLSICPWNKFAQATREDGLIGRTDLSAPRLAELARLDDAGFRAMFARSPIKRIGRNRFLRNVLIAIGNSGNPGLLDVAIEKLADADELVRGAAIWAAGRLAAPRAFKRLAASRMAQESEPALREEWSAALNDLRI